MTRVNPNNGNETNGNKTFFIGRKILKYLNYFYHFPYSILLQK